MIDTRDTDFLATPFFAKIKCEPAWRWPNRDKPLTHYDLFYVWDGVGEVEVNGRSFPVERGSCFLFRPGDRPGASHDPGRPLTLTYIHFQVNGEPCSIPERHQRIRDTAPFETLLAGYVRARLSNAFGAEEEARLLLKQLMVHLLRNAAAEDDPPEPGSRGLREAIAESANYIREHPSEWPALEELAARAGLSPAYYSKQFKRLMGVSVRTHIVRSRIERARFLLTAGGLNVSEVADALGYADVYFFSRQYKQYTGETPSQAK